MEPDSAADWTEETSAAFLRFGRYLVPARETQIDIICRLLPAGSGPFTVVELATGDGVLAEAILTRFDTARVVALDGSARMRRHAARRLQRFGARVRLAPFTLESDDWRRSRQFGGPVEAIVSSLTIHHLDNRGKAALFSDLLQLLAPGGALIIADLIQPAGPEATALAASLWDEAVRDRSVRLAGSDEAFEFFRREGWNIFRSPDPMDRPAPLADQLRWLAEAGFTAVDVYWLFAGHAIYGGRRGPAGTGR